MQITNLQTELAKLESQLDSLGPLSWIKRRQLQKEINNKQKDIRELEKKKEEL
jgi:predicted RNase H-like nuclease (RuvC/YqgF family)